MALLGSSLSDDNILKIVDCETFKKAWKAIESCNENKTIYEPRSLYGKLNPASDVSSGRSGIRGVDAQLKNLQGGPKRAQ